MASTLIINGVRYSRDRPVTYSNEELGHPVGHLRRVDPNWTDGPWRIRYRMIDRPGAEQQWLTMPEIRRLLSKDEAWIIQAVHDGKLDTAMVRGSGIPLFRILNRAAVLEQTIFTETERETKQKSVINNNKDWHRKK